MDSARSSIDLGVGGGEPCVGGVFGGGDTERGADFKRREPLIVICTILPTLMGPLREALAV